MCVLLAVALSLAAPPRAPAPCLCQVGAPICSCSGPVGDCDCWIAVGHKAPLPQAPPARIAKAAPPQAPPCCDDREAGWRTDGWRKDAGGQWYRVVPFGAYQPVQPTLYYQPAPMFFGGGFGGFGGACVGGR